MQGRGIDTTEQRGGHGFVALGVGECRRDPRDVVIGIFGRDASQLEESHYAILDWWCGGLSPRRLGALQLASLSKSDVESPQGSKGKPAMWICNLLDFGSAIDASSSPRGYAELSRGIWLFARSLTSLIS